MSTDTAKQPYNPPRTTATVWWVITSLAAFGIIAPFIFDLDCMRGGCAIAFVCFFLTIVGLIVAIMYQRRAVALDKILYGKDLLARWTYSADEWKQYADGEYRRERSGKQKLFIVVAVIALVIGGGFAAIVRNEGGLWVLAAMGGLIAIIAFVAYFTPWYNYRQNLRYPGEVFIAQNGIYYSRQLHLWDRLGTSLVRAGYREDAQPYLEIVYEEATDPGMREYEVRVPVPAGREKEARELVEKLRGLIQT